MPKTLPEIFEGYKFNPPDPLAELVTHICVSVFEIEWIDTLFWHKCETVDILYREAIRDIGPGVDADGRTGADILDLIACSLAFGEPLPITDFELASAVANFSRSIHASK